MTKKAKNGQGSTTCKIVNLENFILKLCTHDYIVEVTQYSGRESLVPFSCPPCLEYLSTRPDFLRLIRCYINHVGALLTYLFRVGKGEGWLDLDICPGAPEFVVTPLQIIL